MSKTQCSVLLIQYLRMSLSVGKLLWLATVADFTAFSCRHFLSSCEVDNFHSTCQLISSLCTKPVRMYSLVLDYCLPSVVHLLLGRGVCLWHNGTKVNCRVFTCMGHLDFFHLLPKVEKVFFRAMVGRACLRCLLLALALRMWDQCYLLGLSSSHTPACLPSQFNSSCVIDLSYLFTYVQATIVVGRNAFRLTQAQGYHVMLCIGIRSCFSCRQWLEGVACTCVHGCFWSCFQWKLWSFDYALCFQALRPFWSVMTCAACTSLKVYV